MTPQKIRAALVYFGDCDIHELQGDAASIAFVHWKMCHAGETNGPEIVEQYEAFVYGYAAAVKGK